MGPDRLRFDFSHFEAVTPQQQTELEAIVNKVILDNLHVGIIETTQDVAKEMGATALFGEKYGDQVRVVMVDNFSRELCGGTHVGSTAEIGLFRIVSEAGVGSGVRRIEAVTGFGAIELVKTHEQILSEAAMTLKTRPEDVNARIDTLLSRVKELEKEIAVQNTKLAKGVVDELVANCLQVGTLKIAAGQVEASDMDNLRNVADLVRDRIGDGVVVLGAVSDSKVNFVVMATKEAVAQGIHAGNIVKAAAKAAGGGGGGRADMAQAGGKEPEKAAEALKLAVEVAQSQVK